MLKGEIVLQQAGTPDLGEIKRRGVFIADRNIQPALSQGENRGGQDGRIKAAAVDIERKGAFECMPAGKIVNKIEFPEVGAAVRHVNRRHIIFEAVVHRDAGELSGGLAGEVEHRVDTGGGNVVGVFKQIDAVDHITVVDDQQLQAVILGNCLRMGKIAGDPLHRPPGIEHDNAIVAGVGDIKKIVGSEKHIGGLAEAVAIGSVQDRAEQHVLGIIQPLELLVARGDDREFQLVVRTARQEQCSEERNQEGLHHPGNIHFRYLVFTCPRSRSTLCVECLP